MYQVSSFSVPTRQILIKTGMTNFFGELPDLFVFGVSLRINRRRESKREWVIFVFLYFIDMVPDVTPYVIQAHSERDRFKFSPLDGRIFFLRL